MLTKEEIGRELDRVLERPLEESRLLLDRARELRSRTIGDLVSVRGLIELSNLCEKDCYYCGIRRGNRAVERYELTDPEVLAAARYAWQAGYGSVVIQAGERTSPRFTERIERLIRQIKELSGGELGITLSLGEQSRETYRRWREAGAHRYLLRIETSNPELYRRIHPADHSWAARRHCLDLLRETGYQVGTGVMIGLPGQTTRDLAADIHFLRELDVDMCGMGPYIEHPEAPLPAVDPGYTPGERFRLALGMIALLRLSMPDINIAATTALYALHPRGREMGVDAGANVVMPNISPASLRGNYRLYADKPLVDMDLSGFNVALDGRWGDSQHYRAREASSDCSK